MGLLEFSRSDAYCVHRVVTWRDHVCFGGGKEGGGGGGGRVCVCVCGGGGGGGMGACLQLSSAKKSIEPAQKKAVSQRVRRGWGEN